MPPYRSYLLSRLLLADQRAPRGVLTLEREAVIPASLQDTFTFFSDAANLQQITPPWLHFKMLTPLPIPMREGLEIHYRLRLHGIAMPWVSRIDLWEPGVRFVDRQLVGPYRWWLHEHRFEPIAGGTLMRDRVTYLPRARWFTAALVRRQLEQIFSYRQNTLRKIFDGLG